MKPKELGRDFSALCCVYEKFLIGTEKCEQLVVGDFALLKTLAQVARTYPESLRHLRILQSTYYLEPMLTPLGNHDPEVIKAVLEMFKKVQNPICSMRTKHNVYFSVLLRSGDLLPQTGEYICRHYHVLCDD
jgi:hypothetical protein